MAEPFDQLDNYIDSLLSHREPAIPNHDAELSSLAGIAADLRDLPSPAFKQRLREELTRRTTMSPAVSSPVREGFRTVTPYLVVGQGTEFLEFLKQAFGAEETYRGATPGGFHAELRLGDSMLMVGGSTGPANRPSSLATLHFFVENPDEVHRRCVQLGAKSMYGPAEGYGERYAVVEDPAGNWWVLARRLSGSYRPEGRPDLNVFLNPPDAPAVIEFMKNGLGAEVLERHDAPEGTGVHYARLQVGDTVVEMGMPRPGWQPTTMTLLYVPDSDALYHRALAAGAKSLSAPADLPYGRSSGVVDLAGYQWYFCTPPATPRS